MSGLKLAVSFSITPNRLGFCGPQGSKEQGILREFLYTGKDQNQARKILEKFEGAFSYYQLIAKKNKIRDPFQEKVIEAYWIGNELLEKINAGDLGEMIMKKFTRPGLLTKNEAKKRIKNIPSQAKPHHSFHVYIFGTVTGTIDLNTPNLKNICRVGWGRVVKIYNSKSKISVEYQPIVGTKKLHFGKRSLKELDWNRDTVSNLKCGDWVAFHWGAVCKSIDQKERHNLKKYTQNILNLL